MYTIQGAWPIEYGTAWYPGGTPAQDLAWRIRFTPKVKTMSGEKAEDPQSLQLRLSFLEMMQNGQRDSSFVAVKDP